MNVLEEHVVRIGGGTKTHLHVPATGGTRTMCGKEIDQGTRPRDALPEGTEVTCARCRPYAAVQTAERPTTHHFDPNSEAGARVVRTQRRSGRLLYNLYGLKGFTIATREEVVIGVGLAAMEAGRDPRVIVEGLKLVTLV
jgi:hypothetical protein